MPSTMKAAFLVEYGQPLEIREVAIPEPKDGEILVKLDVCGVCHSDVHFWKGEHELPGNLPQILGHEGIGRVVKSGNNNSRFNEGDRVGVGYVYDTCHHCRECRTGHETNCGEAEATGVHVSGCYAEYVCLREEWTTRIPESLDAFDAAPLLCAGVAAYSAVRKANLEAGKLAAVFGAGGLGLYAIQVAKLSGARVVAVDIDADKLALAKEMGADYTIKANENPEDFIQSLGGADACLNFAPVASTWKQMLASCSPRGKIMLIALPNGDLSFNAADIVESGLTIQGSADGTRQEIKQLMDLAESGRVSSITEKLPFDQINSAFQRVAEGKLNSRIVLDIKG
ncbi:MAG: zinc-dependent alcohol dehydrogenase [Motiliproteus sp.]